MYSVGNGMRAKTAGGTFGVKTGSAFGQRPQTAKNVGPGAYNLGSATYAGSMSRAQDKGFGMNGKGKVGRAVESNVKNPGPG